MHTMHVHMIQSVYIQEEKIESCNSKLVTPVKVFLVADELSRIEILTLGNVIEPN